MVSPQGTRGSTLAEVAGHLAFPQTYPDYTHRLSESGRELRELEARHCSPQCGKEFYSQFESTGSLPMNPMLNGLLGA